MNMDSLMKYIMWAVIFGICFYALYRLFSNLGVA